MSARNNNIYSHLSSEALRAYGVGVGYLDIGITTEKAKAVALEVDVEEFCDQQELATYKTAAAAIHSAMTPKMVEGKRKLDAFMAETANDLRDTLRPVRQDASKMLAVASKARALKRIKTAQAKIDARDKFQAEIASVIGSDSCNDDKVYIITQLAVSFAANAVVYEGPGDGN